ncbi:MAG: hypothetical protein AAF502_19785 [Bacteroidota bacterium]
MRNLYLAPIILVALVLMTCNSSLYGQCNPTSNSGGACAPRSNFYFGELVPNNGCDNFAVTNSFDNGEYFRMPVLEGGCYTISTCGSNFNTQLALFEGTNASVPFGWQDNNGPACSGNEASYTFSPSFTDYTRVNVKSFSCQTWTPQSATVSVRQNNNLAFTSSNADMCQGATRTLTAVPLALSSAQPNSGDLGSFSGPGVVGNTFTAPIPIGASEVFTITYTFGFCSVTQDITVVSTSGSPANAGPDQFGLTSTTTNLTATPPTTGTGVWTVLSGSGGSIDDSSSPTGLFTGVLGETYILQWTVTSGSCVSTDNVILEFLPTFTSCDETPNGGGSCTPRSSFFFGELLPNAGCESFAVTNGYDNGEYFRMPVLEGGCYSISTCGSGFDTQLTLYQGTNTTSPFKWRDDDGPFCGGLEASLTFEANFSDYTRVNVNQYDCQIYTTNSATVSVRQNNNLGFLSSTTDMCEGASRLLSATPTPISGTVLPGSGDAGTFTGTGVSGNTFTGPSPAGFAQMYTQTYTFGYCTATQQITVYSLPSAANAGPDQLAIPATSTTLAANSPAIGNGVWSIVSGINGVINDPTSPTSTFSGVLGNTYILRWTVSNGPCSVTIDEVTIEFFIPCDPPQIICPQNVVVECGQDTNPPATGLATGITNCDPNPLISFTDDADFQCAGAGEIIRTWTITDLEGSMASCSQIITVEDTTIPIVNCPVDPPPFDLPLGFNTDPVGPFTPQDPSIDPNVVGAPVIDENCGMPNVTYQDVLSGPNGDCSMLWIVSRTWTVTDPCGQVNSCVQTFTFMDTTDPVVTCPTGILLPPLPSQEVEPNDTPSDAGVLTINGETILTGNADPTPGLDTWIIPDGTSGDITVEIQNITSPVTLVTVNCYIDQARTILNTPYSYTPFDPPLVVTLDPVFYYTITVGDFIPGSAYEVFVTGSPLQSFGPLVPFECPVGFNTDPVGPNTPQDPLIAPSVTGIPEATDNFSLASLDYQDVVSGPIQGSCPLVWTVTRTWTATDFCGFTATCDQVFEFEDTTPPTISCPADPPATPLPGDLILDPVGQNVPQAPSLDPVIIGGASALDNCGIASLDFQDALIGPDPSDCSALASVVRTWTATDHCGLSVECIQTFIFTGNTPPVVDCPIDLALELPPGFNSTPVPPDTPQDPLVDPNITGFAVISDNFGIASSGYQDVLIGPSPANCPDLWILERTWSATNVCGLTTSCVQTFTILDTTPPMITCPPDQSFECMPGFNLTPVPPGIPQDPTIDPSITGNPVISDNYAIESVFFADMVSGPDPSSCPGVIEVQRLWTVTDACGLSASCTQIITISDNTPPVANCAQDITIQINVDGEAIITEADVDNGSTDNCGSVSLSLSQSFFDCSQTGLTVVNVTVTDQCGLTDICQVNVLIENPTTLSAVVSNETGPGVANGAIDLTVSNANPPLDFFWSNGETTEDISGLTGPANYSVTVSDPFGCEVIGTYFVDELGLSEVEFCLNALIYSLFNPFSLPPMPPMSTTLRDQGLIPTGQPYNAPPWNYSGTETFGSPAQVPTNMSAWMLMRLRPVSDPATVYAQEAVVLLSDGSIVDVNGALPRIFLDPIDDYWLEITHINHLPVFAPSPLVVQQIGGQFCHDFTTSMSQAYSDPSLNDDPMIEMNSLGGLFYGLIAGNAQNLDCQVEANDINMLFFNYLGPVGYTATDINRDGLTDVNDINMLLFFYNRNGHKPF